MIGHPTVDCVIGVAARSFGITVNELMESRHQPIIGYRRAAMLAAKAVTGRSGQDISVLFGREQHEYHRSIKSATDMERGWAETLAATASRVWAETEAT